MFKNKAVMYLRLSKEDAEAVESNSISNQRELIKSYIKGKDIELIGEYVDDGYSGANFKRLGFNRMIDDAYEKKFDTVIVKDLSRFGRDYIGAGRYIQRIFPQIGVRFISVNDNYDSKHADMSDTHLILPIKNFINDSYSRDISSKVKSSQRVKRMNGEYIGAFAPYGYKKSEENKNKLVIDENVKNIIKAIFDMKLQGYSSKAIGDELNGLGIDSPKIYKEKQGLNYKGGFETIKGGRWSAKAINRILENKVYIGMMQQGKSATISYKNKKQLEINPSDWISVENTHEPIVSEEVFHIANILLKRDFNTKANQQTELFAGMLFCKDCNSPMVRRTVKTNRSTDIFYICSKYNKEKTCTRHSIKQKALEETITGLLKQYISFNEKLYGIVKNINFNVDIKDSQIAILQREKEMTENLISSLYTDLEEDVITKEEYQLFRKNYLEQLSKLEENIKNRLEKQKDIKDSIQKNKNWIIDIKKYKELSKLDRLSLVMLIDRILIGENKEIEVIFNHAQKLEMIEEITKEKSNENMAYFFEPGKTSRESEVCEMKKNKIFLKVSKSERRHYRKN